MNINALLAAVLASVVVPAIALPSPDYGYYKPQKQVWSDCSANDIVGKKVLIESVDPHNQYKKGGDYGYGDSMPRVLDAHGDKWDVTMEEANGSKTQVFTIEDSGYNHNKYVIRSYKWDDKCLASVVENTKSNSHVLLSPCDKKHYDGEKKDHYDDYSKSYDTGYGDDTSSSSAGPVYRRDYDSYDQKPKYEKPKYDKPSYDDKKPKYEDKKPKYEDKHDYDKPKYEKPKYEKPKYEEPKYEKPKYEKPKYEKPKYEDKHDYGYHYDELSKEWSLLCNEKTHEVMLKSTSGKCLDDYGATQDHVDVTTYPCEEGNSHQYWKLYVVKDKGGDYGSNGYDDVKQYEEV